MDYQIQRILENNGQEININEAENNIDSVIYASYLESNLFKESGFILGLYRIFGVATFLTSLVSNISNQDEIK